MKSINKVFIPVAVIICVVVIALAITRPSGHDAHDSNTTGGDHKETANSSEAMDNHAKPANPHAQMGETKKTEDVSELKIEEIQVGTGAEAVNNKTVSVHYTGRLTNGKKFDSSLDSGQPLKFVLGAGHVIKGWEQGILGMKTGGKRKLTIPPNLAYGERGAGGGVIPPNATLVFDVELISVE